MQAPGAVASEMHAGGLLLRRAFHEGIASGLAPVAEALPEVGDKVDVDRGELRQAIKQRRGELQRKSLQAGCGGLLRQGAHGAFQGVGNEALCGMGCRCCGNGDGPVVEVRLVRVVDNTQKLHITWSRLRGLKLVEVGRLMLLHAHAVSEPKGAVEGDGGPVRWHKQRPCTMVLIMPGSPEFMQQAIQLATENVLHGRGGPFGAVVVKDGQVIATGANQVTATNDPTAHAEVVALRNACQVLGTFELPGCDVYTSCEPCPMCLGALYWSRCRTVFYGNDADDAARAGFDDAYLYEEVNKPVGERRLPMERLLAEEARSSFDAWRKSPYRVEY